MLRRTTVVAALLLVASCGSHPACHPTAKPKTCHDLTFRGHAYDEWKPLAHVPTGRQELGDAGYPACNAAQHCGDKALEGSGGSDATLLDGVDPKDAVIGIREGTDHTFVIFVRVGVDPAKVRAEIDPKLVAP